MADLGGDGRRTNRLASDKVLQNALQKGLMPNQINTSVS